MKRALQTRTAVRLSCAHQGAGVLCACPAGRAAFTFKETVS